MRDLHAKLGIPMTYAPKLHVELQEKIERPWAYVKVGCRENCSYSITELRINVPKYLSAVPLDMFRKWEQSTVYWEQAYRCGHTIATAAAQVKQ